MEQEKEIRWMGTAYQDILEFPAEPRKEAGFQLSKVRAGLDPDNWKPFDEVGSGTKEIRIRETAGIYRVMYVAKFEEAIYVLHCFQKKQKRLQDTIGMLQKPVTSHCERKKGQNMTTSTKIQHVTKPGVNIFLELGFESADAARLQTEAQQRINDTKMLKEQLMEELSKWIAENHLKQAEASEILKVSRPRVSDVVNKKISKFTIDALVDMLSRVGKPVRIAIS